MSSTRRATLDALAQRIRKINEPEREQRLNAIHDKATSTVQNRTSIIGSAQQIANANPELLDSIKNLNTSAIGTKLKGIEQHLSRFVETSAVIMKGLEAVQKIHPFIGVAVAILKTAIELEITRRENNRKVIFLKDKMLDMMNVLCSLQDIHDVDQIDDEGVTIKGHIQRALEAAETSMKDCSALCESYMNKTFCVKLLDSIRWDGRLATFGDKFDEHKKEFVLALTVHTAKGTDRLNVLLNTSNDQLATLVLFSQLRSPHERELLHFIDDLGGPEACLADDAAFNELLKMVNQKSTRRSNDGDSPEKLLASVRTAMSEDMDQVLAKERRMFDHKFNAIMATLAEVTHEVRRNTDRVIDALGKGPHDRIIDQDLYNVWKDMAWRGSVKARHFIIAVQDYFFQKYGKRSPDVATVELTDSSKGIPMGAQSQRLTDAGDIWALKYITLTRIRSIYEAFDDDASGWISVHEANMFTRERPESYSVVKWLAFWAAGFQVTCINYAEKIDTLRMQMIHNARHVLPCNRLSVDNYIANQDLSSVDYLVYGILNSKRYDNNDSELSTAFNDHVAEEEKRLRQNLERFNVIDASNTLSIIVGSGRLERHILPILYLVLQRHADIIRLAASVRIDDEEFNDAVTSIATIVEALMDRVKHLLFVFHNQNLDPKKQFEQSYNEMYSLLYIQYTGDYVTLDKIRYQNAPQVPIEEPRPSFDMLKYDYGPLEAPSQFYESFIGESTTSIDSSTCSGLWTGRRYYGSIGREHHGGSLILDIRLHDDNTVTGEGKDGTGMFTLAGTATPTSDADPGVLRVKFKTKQVYLSIPGRLNPIFYYTGKIERDESGMYVRFFGKWSQLKDDEESNKEGDFLLDRSLPIVTRYKTSSPVDSNRAQARWTMLRHIVLEQVRQKMWSWSYFRQRRDNRIIAVEAQMRILVESGLNSYMRTYPEGEEDRDFEQIRCDIEMTTPVEDVIFYRWLAQQRLRGETAHMNILCDGCEATPIGARYICLDCNPIERTQVMDLCALCTGKAIDDPDPTRMLHHVPSHDLLKTLRVLSVRELVVSVNIARIRLATALSKFSITPTGEEATEEEPGPSCYNCYTPVYKPCWYCVECTGSVFICDICEKKQLVMSTRHPMLVVTTKVRPRDSTVNEAVNGGNTGSAPSHDTLDSLHAEDDGGSHIWWHLLVRVKGAPDSPAKASTVDDRLMVLEDRITRLIEQTATATAQSSASDSTRMERLEASVTGISDRISTLETLVRTMLGK